MSNFSKEVLLAYIKSLGKGSSDVKEFVKENKEVAYAQRRDKLKELIRRCKSKKEGGDRDGDRDKVERGGQQVSKIVEEE